MHAKAVNYMYQKITECKRNVTLIATGSLTNIALLINIYPEVLDKVEQFVILGGAIVNHCFFQLISGSWKHATCIGMEHLC